MTIQEAVGRYTLVRPLASGGMGDVFLARVTGSGGHTRPAVIKRLRQDLRHREDAEGMFLDEARLSSQLSHPHIVEVFDIGATPDGFYMAMEFIDGIHLGKLMRTAIIKERPLSVPASMFICARIAEALHYAHHARDLSTGEPLKVVHRDVSPSNILISRDGDVKLTDFGVAKAQTQQVKTAMGFVKGKVAYLSPEQVDLKPLDGRSDVFSLGIVLWELLARMRLYKERDAFVAMNRISRESCPKPSDYNPGVPQDAEAICLAALRKSPDERFSTAGALQGAIDQWLRGCGLFQEKQNLAALIEGLKDDLDLEEKERTEVISHSASASVLLAALDDASGHVDDQAETIDVEEAPRHHGGRPSFILSTPQAGPVGRLVLADPPETPERDASQITTVKEIPFAGIAAVLDDASATPTRRAENTRAPDAALPQFDTRFVGRASELAAISTHLLGKQRGLMLCGPEGIGKTRLAVEAARRLHAPDAALDLNLSRLRIYFCDLVGIRDPSTAIERLMRALGFADPLERDDARAFETLRNQLQARPNSLLIMDGVTHDAEWLKACLSTWMDTTSGARLLLTGRQPVVGVPLPVFGLHPLRQTADGSGTNTPASDADEGFDAIDLFVQRMRTTQPSYVLTDQDAATVGRIVARLGGNPLAIEIAAGQVRGADVATLLERIDEDGEHKWNKGSVSAAFDLGLEMLDDTMSTALIQASIFPGQIPIAAAEHILQLPSDATVHATFDRLLQRALLRRERVTVSGIHSDGYRIAEGLRKRAAEQLATWSGRFSLEERFSAYFIDRGEDLVGQSHGPLNAIAHEKLIAEQAHLALTAEYQLGDTRSARRADNAIRTALVSDAHLVANGSWDRHIALLDRAVEVSNHNDLDDPSLRRRIYLARGRAYFEGGQVHKALVDLEKAWDEATQHADHELAARVGYERARAYRALEGSSAARGCLEQANQLVELHQLHRVECYVLSASGELFFDDGLYEKASPLLMRALRLAEEMQIEHCAALTTSRLARLHAAQGNIEGAIQLANHALGQFRALKDRRGQADLGHVMADCYATHGHFDMAERLMTEALTIVTDTGDAGRKALLMVSRGALKAARQDTLGAQADLQTAEQALSALGLHRLLSSVALGRGLLNLAHAQTVSAEQAFALVQQAREHLTQGQNVVPELAQRLRHALG